MLNVMGLEMGGGGGGGGGTIEDDGDGEGGRGMAVIASSGYTFSKVVCHLIGGIRQNKIKKNQSSSTSKAG